MNKFTLIAAIAAKYGRPAERKRRLSGKTPDGRKVKVSFVAEPMGRNPEDYLAVAPHGIIYSETAPFGEGELKSNAADEFGGEAAESVIRAISKGNAEFQKYCETDSVFSEMACELADAKPAAK